MKPGKILVAEHQGTYALKFIGEVRLTLCTTLDGFLDVMFKDKQFQSVIVDLQQASYLDSTTLGLLAKISIQSKQKHQLVTSLISTNDNITRLLYSMGFDQIFAIVDKPMTETSALEELSIMQTSEEDTKNKVLEAHKILMSLNEKNQEAFKDLVNTLEMPDLPSDNK